jgi:signal transduction histidine kinase
MGISGDLPPEAQVDVQAIFDNGQALLRIVDDVLDLSKMEAGTLSLTVENLEIAPLLQRVWANSAALLADKEVEMLLQVEDDLSQVEADPARVEQIVNNLVNNAIKFTEQGSIVLRTFRDGDWLCLEVQDTGLGIDEAHQEIIFESFRQVDGSHARRAGGTGLGLSITRRLVELHGGTIEVHSRLGEGSTFSVRLPISRS